MLVIPDDASGVHGLFMILTAAAGTKIGIFIGLYHNININVSVGGGHGSYSFYGR